MGVRRKLLTTFALWSLTGAALLIIVGAVATAADRSGLETTESVGSGPINWTQASAAILIVRTAPESKPGYQSVLATNSSGFAQHTRTKGVFSAVEDSWNVPKVNTSLPGKQFASDWVGIGGYADGTLVQAGTSERNNSGAAKYNAWTEVIPYPEVPLTGLRIRPGDLIRTSVVETSTDEWVLTVEDVTTRASGSRTVHYRSAGRSAEAIHERPNVRGRLSTLATTNNVTFDPGSVSTSGPGKPAWRPLLGTVQGAKLAQIVMVNGKDTTTLATPSAPSSDEQGFRVADGPSPPGAPN